MYYLCFFILIISFLTGRAAPVACSEVFPWIAPKSLTVLGSPFVDVIL
ncbi:putative exported protein, partial [Chlamydia psittaci 84-8471/1]